MAMSPDDLLKWLTIGTMGSQVFTGLAGAGRSSAEREYQQAQDLYNRQQQARAANMAWLNSLMSGQTDRAAMLADRMPLGAEQGYVQRQALLGTMGQNIAGMPLPTGYGGTVNPLAGLDVNRYFGDAQTAAALAERRKALAGIEPNFQFGALSGYGLGDGAAAADRAVADYAKAMGEQRLARENAMTQFLVDQSRAAGLGAQPAGQAGQGEAPKKKGSKWATVGRIAAAAAPFVASGMKNINPQTMKLVQAASGAAQGALSGGGAGGAALGAVSGYMAPAVQPTGVGIREAILNPRAIGTIASAGLPGVYGTLGQMVSSQLRGPRTPDAPMVQSPAAAAPIGESQQRYIQSRLDTPAPFYTADQVAAMEADRNQAILDQFAPQGNAPVARTRAAVAPPRRTPRPTSLTIPGTDRPWSDYDFLGQGVSRPSLPLNAYLPGPLTALPFPLASQTLAEQQQAASLPTFLQNLVRAARQSPTVQNVQALQQAFQAWRQQNAKNVLGAQLDPRTFSQGVPR